MCIAILLAVSLLAAGAARSLRSADARTKPESTRHMKLYLLKRFAKRGGGPPELLILGSSRAMRAEPSVLRRALKVRAFNAAVGAGAPADALAFVRYVRLHYPGQRFSILWLLDIENLRLQGIHPYLRSVPELVDCLPAGLDRRGTALGLPDDGPLGAPPAPVGSAGSRVRALDAQSRWAADGFLMWCYYDYWRAQGVAAATRLQHQLAHYSGIYPPRSGSGLTGWSKWLVRRVIREANAMGGTPVVVLTPYHPSLLRFIAGRGWGRVHKEALGFLRGLRGQFRLRVLDMTSIASFGGWAGGFYDGVHGRPVMIRRLLREVLRRAGPDLLLPSPTPTPTSTPTTSPSPSPSSAG